MRSDPEIRRNLIAMCVMWANSSFSYQLIDFYVKYLPGDIYFTKALFGVMDAASVFYIQLLQASFSHRVTAITKFCLLASVVLCGVYLSLGKASKATPVLIALIRMQTTAQTAYGFYVN